MTEGLKVQKTVLFVGFTLIVQSYWAITSSTGSECKTIQQPSLLNYTSNKFCQKFILNGLPKDQWHEIKCNPFYVGSRSRQKCSFWCSLLARCLSADTNRTGKWIRLCSRKFRKFSRDKIAVSNGNINVNIEVVPGKPFTKGLFVIKASTENKCEMAQPLQGDCESEEAYHAFKSDGSPTNQWNKIKCNSCFCWCELLARCFVVDENDKKKEWISMCSRKFLQFSRFQINVSDVNIEVVPCRRSTDRMFSVRVSEVPISRSELIPCNAENVYEKAMMEFFPSIGKVDFGQENALKDAVSMFGSVIQEFKNVSINYQKMNRTCTEDQKNENTFFTTLAFEDFFIRFAEEQLLNSTFFELSANDSQNVDVRVERVFHHNENGFRFSETKGENFIKIPSGNLPNNGSVVLGVAYKNLHELLTTSHSADRSDTNQASRTLNTIIMSAVIYPPPEKFSENVTMVFSNIKAAGKNRKCVFWDLSEGCPGGWSEKGCQPTKITESQTECVCNHLTHFAVLMDVTASSDSGPGQPLASEEDDKILTVLTQVGLALSLTGVVLTIISYLLLTDRHAPLSHIRVSLTTCIGAVHIIFLAGIDSTDKKGACVTVAALMQYFLMAAFCWMLVEGIYLYLFVVKVYNIADKIRFYHAIAWGLPVVIVAISLSIAAGKDEIQSFVTDKYCWISSENHLIWIFVSFVGLIELVNVVILVRVIKEMTAMQQVKDNQTEQIRLGIRACVVLVPLLGVTWLFGFLLPSHIAFSYIFVILNSTQGLSIFFFHCLRNSEIRERFKRRIQTMFPSAFEETNTDKRISEANPSRDAQTRDVGVIDPNSICELEV